MLLLSEVHTAGGRPFEPGTFSGMAKKPFLYSAPRVPRVTRKSNPSGCSQTGRIIHHWRFVMSRPLLKLPGCRTLQTDANRISSLMQSADSSLLASSLDEPFAHPEHAFPDCETNLNRVRSIAIDLRKRFRPVSLRLFKAYAKNLARLTGEGLSRSQETLAQAYRYESYHELRTQLITPGEPGPFDDLITLEDWQTEEVQAALDERLARVLRIIFSKSAWLQSTSDAGTLPAKIHELRLFCTPASHFEEAKKLDLPKLTSAERKAYRMQFDEG